MLLQSPKRAHHSYKVGSRLFWSWQAGRARLIWGSPADPIRHLTRPPSMSVWRSLSVPPLPSEIPQRPAPSVSVGPWGHDIRLLLCAQGNVLNRAAHTLAVISLTDSDSSVATSLRSVMSGPIGPQPEHTLGVMSNSARAHGCAAFGSRHRPGARCLSTVHHISRSPSVILLTDSEPDKAGPSAPGALRDARSSVISLTDSEPDEAGPSAPEALRDARSSVISLTDSEPDEAGPSAPRALRDTPHANPDFPDREETQGYKALVNFPAATTSDSDTDRTASLPPQLIIKWGSNGCVRSHGQSHENPINVEDIRIWPIDFHVCNIAQFICLTRLPGHHQRLQKMFEEYFGIPYCPRTFRRTRKVWERRANQNLHARFIDYRRSERGLWSTFTKEAKQVI
jgi:hypothetical protein